MKSTQAFGYFSEAILWWDPETFAGILLWSLGILHLPFLPERAPKVSVALTASFADGVVPRRRPACAHAEARLHREMRGDPSESLFRRRLSTPVSYHGQKLWG